MARAVFKSVSGINCDMGEKPSPVRVLGGPGLGLCAAALSLWAWRLLWRAARA